LRHTTWSDVSTKCTDEPEHAILVRDDQIQQQPQLIAHGIHNLLAALHQVEGLRQLSIQSDPLRETTVEAIEAWFRRVWPGVVVPRIGLTPWPVQAVCAVSNTRPALASVRSPLGALPSLNRTDYPTDKELNCA
jgi:hypothetical protein